MKLKLIMSVILVLIKVSSFCQVNYPQKSIINNDTVCIITIDQVKKINTTFIELDQYKELNDTANSRLITYIKLVDNNTDLIKSLESESKVKDQLILQQKGLIDNKKNELKIQEGKTLWLKIQRNALIVVSGILTGLLVIHK